MCSHYQGIKERERFRRMFGVDPPDDICKYDVWPGYAATFIRRPREADVGDEAVPEREAVVGQFGLIPHWATDTTIGRRTFNCHVPSRELILQPLKPLKAEGYLAACDFSPAWT